MQLGQHGRNFDQETASYRSSPHPAQVFQENCERQGYQRYTTRLANAQITNGCAEVLRERYLRDDVGCGIESCRMCPTTTEEILPSSGEPKHKLFPNGHFVLPDTNVFLAQMDLIESSLFAPPIILLQTVIEEVRHRSLPLYNRLKAIMKAEEKRVWVFYNEYRSSVCE